MNRKLLARPYWSTASFGETPDTSPGELSALGEHLDVCRGARGRLFSLRCAAQMVGGFLAARFVTTVAAVTLLIGLSTLLL